MCMSCVKHQVTSYALVQIFSTISQIDERPFVVMSEPHLRSGSLPPISSMTRCQVGTPVRKSG